MTRGAIRISLTILPWITCMTQGFSINKESSIEGKSYIPNEEFLYDGETYYNNIQSGYNEINARKNNIREHQETETDEGTGNKNKKKLQKLISIENYNIYENQPPRGVGCEKQYSPIQKRNYPLSDQQINPATFGKRHLEMYIFNPQDFNENAVRELVGPKHQYLLPKCYVNQPLESNDNESNLISYHKKIKEENYYLKPKSVANNDVDDIDKLNNFVLNSKENYNDVDMYPQWNEEKELSEEVVRANDKTTFLSQSNRKNSAELNNTRQNKDLPQLISMNDLRNQLELQLFPTKSGKNEQVIDPKSTPIVKIQTIEQNKEMNSINTDIKYDKKNKIWITATRASPALHVNEVTPNASYIYQQPVPVTDSVHLQKVGEAFYPLNPNISLGNMSSPVITNENGNNGLINKSIDFLKIFNIKKIPKMLGIELSPTDALHSKNFSKQKVVPTENSLQIAALLNNSSVKITGDKIATDHSNEVTIHSRCPISSTVANKNQQDILLEQPKIPEDGTPVFSRVGNDQQKKSISTSSNVNDFQNDNISQTDGKKSMKTINEPKKTLMKQTKKEHQYEAACNSPSLCGLNLSEPDLQSKKSILNLENVKEINDGLRESKELNYNNKNNIEIKKFTNSNMRGSCGRILDSSQSKMKREADQLNESNLINMLKPVIVLDTKGDDEDEMENNPVFLDRVNLKGSSEITFEKGNKKVENKILEGFINSIIANYSKDGVKPISKQTTERTEEEEESLFRLLEQNIPNKVETEESKDIKSDEWNLAPILIPESSISKYGDSSEYAKLGPFGENIIKSFLKKDSIPFLREEKQGNK